MAKPLHRCGHAGCRELIDYDVKYCERHKDSYSKQYNKFRWNNQNDYVKFYNSKAWRELSKSALIDSYYTCKMCGQDAVLSDHIIPTEIDWNKRLDKNNIQTLCHRCHTIKTREDEKKYNLKRNGKQSAKNDGL